MLRYFQLRDQPFGVTPDPAFWFSSETHREALASLLYGVEAGRGFVSLIAKPGMGKTTLLFNGLRQLQASTHIAFLFQPILRPEDFLHELLAELGTVVKDNHLPHLQSQLRELCTEYDRAGKRIVVVIDEAQSLPVDVLEFVRMLSNFETPRRKLLQVVLSGQPQLAVKLSNPEMLQLRQRVSVFAHLEPLSPAETEQYIRHRLTVAGFPVGRRLFTKDALALIARHSDGIPRNINNICFNALSLAYASQQREIDARVVREVVADLSLEAFVEAIPVPSSAEPQTKPPSRSWLRHAPALAAIFAVLAVTLYALLLHLQKQAQQGEVTMQHDRPAMVPQITGGTAVGDAVPPASPGANTLSVIVTKGQTLFGICSENFIACRPETMAAIRDLNPQLSNPNHVETGQTIRLPRQDHLNKTLEGPPKEHEIDPSTGRITQ